MTQDPDSPGGSPEAMSPSKVATDTLSLRARPPRVVRFRRGLMIGAVAVGAIGLSGLFVLTAALAFGGVVTVLWGVPPEPSEHRHLPRGKLSEVLTHPGLLRLDFGVFMLHAVQLAMWVAVPALLVDAGLPKNHHWWVYLPAITGSFLVMGGVIAGWVEALQLMNAGSKWRLHVPSELAYGGQAVGSIPPHSVLVFDVELLEIL